MQIYTAKWYKNLKLKCKNMSMDISTSATKERKQGTTFLHIQDIELTCSKHTFCILSHI